MLKTVKISILICSLFLFTGCFNIIHFLSLNTDGTISVNWRISLSRALEKKKKKEGKSLSESFKNAEPEFIKKSKGSLKDFVFQELSTTHEAGVVISFTLKDSVKIEDQKRFPIIPFYDKTKKTLSFYFRPEKKEGKPNAKKETKKGGMGNLAQAIMSSAKYQIILGGKFKATNAYIVGKTDQKKYSLDIIKLGTQYFINFPFMSYLIVDKKGYDLIVELK